MAQMRARIESVKSAQCPASFKTTDKKTFQLPPGLPKTAYGALLRKVTQAVKSGGEHRLRYRHLSGKNQFILLDITAL